MILLTQHPNYTVSDLLESISDVIEHTNVIWNNFTHIKKKDY